MVKTGAISEAEKRELRAKRREEDRLIKKKMKASRKINDTFEDKVFYAIINTILTLLLLVIAIPCLYVVACSFSDADQVIAGNVIAWPIKFTLEGYEAIFNNGTYDIISAFRNSIFYTFAGTVIALFLTYLCAYPLARKNLPGGSKVMMLYTITMFISGGMIPGYMLIDGTLGLSNTVWPLILIGAINVQNMIIARTFMGNSIPGELLEASQIDGCDDFGFFVKIVLPLSKASIAVLALYYAIAQWNNFMNALLYIQKDALQPLQIVLRAIIINNEAASGGEVDSTADASKIERLKQLLKYSTIVVSVIPVLIIYPFVQKHFVKGVMIGAIKG